jgi:hypothetical protein
LFVADLPLDRKDEEMSTTGPEWTPEGTQAPRKPGMSTGAKVVIILLVVFGILVVVCCGGVIGIGMFAKKAVTDMFSKDPTVVAAKTEEITEIEIPEGLEPEGSLDATIPFTDQRVLLWTAYTDKESGSSLILCAAGEAFPAQGQEDMRREMEKSLKEQGMGGQEEIPLGEASTQEREIRGQPATFSIVKGAGDQSGTERVQVVGFFRGKKGDALLMLDVDAEKYSEEDIVEMIDSIE